MTDGGFRPTVHGPRRFEAPLKVVAIFLPLVALIALPVVAGDSNTSASRLSTPTAQADTSDAEEIQLITDTALELDKQTINPAPNQLTYVNLGTGDHIGTVSERFSRPALSLAKLYIADYVFDHGNQSQKNAAIEMIEDSSDRQADELFDDFPDCITDTAEKYNLQSTFTYGRWGYSYTSTFDIVSFLTQLLRTDPNSEILEAMKDAASTAEDGTKQNFGTDRLAGVEGSKWGWSDDNTLHSSVSFGTDGDGNTFVAAAMITGSDTELTEYTKTQLGDVVGMASSRKLPFFKAIGQ